MADVGGFGITGHYGKPGASKSRDMVEQDIIPALQSGRTVYTNLPLLVDGIMAYYSGIRPEQIHILSGDEVFEIFLRRAELPKDNPGEMAHSLVLIDEIQDYFPSGVRTKRGKDDERYDYIARARDAFITWLSWSRHDDCEFVWATQSWASVDIEVRRRTLMYCQHENLFHLGLKKTWVVRYQLPDQISGDPNPETCRERLLRPNPIIYRCYKSSEVGNHQLSSRLGAMIPKKLIIFAVLTILVIALSVILYIRHGNPFSADRFSDKSLKNIVQPTITDTVRNQPKTQNVSTGVRNEIDSYICIYTRCLAYSKGVYEYSYQFEYVDTVYNVRPSLRADILERDVQRSSNGGIADMPR